MDLQVCVWVCECVCVLLCVCFLGGMGVCGVCMWSENSLVCVLWWQDESVCRVFACTLSVCVCMCVEVRCVSPQPSLKHAHDSRLNENTVCMLKLLCQTHAFIVRYMFVGSVYVCI